MHKIRKFLNKKKYKFIYDEFDENVKIKKIITPLYPDIMPYYEINELGQIRNYITKNIIHPSIKGNGYYQFNLRCKIHNKNDKPILIDKYFSIHRMLMVIFNPIENMENYIVNHKDGNKLNNSLSNLEWVTHKENVVHAFKTGLIKINKCEKSPNTNLKNKDVKKICKLWMTGKYRTIDIANMFEIPRSIVLDIVNKRSWRDITDKYDFSNRPVFRAINVLSIEDIHKICKYFEKNNQNDFKTKRQYYISALKYIGFNKEIDNNILRILYTIHHKKGYKNIISNYNY